MLSAMMVMYLSIADCIEEDKYIRNVCKCGGELFRHPIIFEYILRRPARKKYKYRVEQSDTAVPQMAEKQDSG